MNTLLENQDTLELAEMSTGLEISKITFNQTKNSKPPESFVKAYDPIAFKTITPSTFWQEFMI